MFAEAEEYRVQQSSEIMVVHHCLIYWPSVYPQAHRVTLTQIHRCPHSHTRPYSPLPHTHTLSVGAAPPTQSHTHLHNQAHRVTCTLTQPHTHTHPRSRTLISPTHRYSYQYNNQGCPTDTLPFSPMQSLPHNHPYHPHTHSINLMN